MAEDLTTNAKGERSITIGGDVIHSILITGDHNQVFVGDYERLRDAYIEPWPVFERVNLDRFTGREWLIAEVDACLQGNDRGYFVLEAEAGLGKTTFLAHLIKERGYIHHFVELAPGLDGIARGLRNLAAQLVRAWELDPYLAEGVLPSAASRPDFLQDLLFKAARKRDEVRPEEKIVWAVDALDEAGTPYGQNVLGLPEVLPEGVYFIVSHRPVEVALKVEGPRRVFRLRAGDRDNLVDMRRYLEQAATREKIAQALAEQGYGREQFVETLLAKCQGVWIYLHYVVGEIERGKRSPLDLEALPEGLWQYYAQHWARWREKGEWYDTYLPLLSTLAAAQEGLTLPFLCTLAGVEARPELRRLLDERWRPFLAVEKEGDGRRYRLYHASLREFLDGQVDFGQSTEAEQSLARELATAAREAHGRIADRYLTAWGGLEAGLPGLREPEKRGIDGGYGLRYLVAHLEGAGRVDDLHRLLRMERKQEGRRENAWCAAKETTGDTAGYLADVARAWRLAETECATRSMQHAIGLQCRYALITATMNSVAKNLPPALLAVLLEKGMWTPAQGLAYTRQIPDPEQQVEALAVLVSHLPRELLGEALAVACAIKDERIRANALANLIPYLPKELLGEVLTVAHVIKDGRIQANVLVGLIPYLPAVVREQALREALAAAREIQDAEDRVNALAKLASRLAESGYPEKALAVARELPETGHWSSPRSEALVGLVPHIVKSGYPPKKALAVVQDIRDALRRAKALARLAPHLPEELLKEALAAAREIQRADLRAEALTELAPRLPTREQKQILREALGAVKKLPEVGLLGNPRAEALTKLAPHLPKGLLGEALAAACTIEDESYRASVLTGLTPYLPEKLMGEALAAVQEIRRGYVRVEALAGLASYLPEEEREQALREALAAAREIQDAEDRVNALAELASRLAELGYPEKALTVARELPETGHWGASRAKALARLAPRLAESGYPKKALAVARGIKQGYIRAKALAELAPHLPKGLLKEALAAAREIQSESDRARALAGLAPCLAELGYSEEVLEATREIRGEDDCAQALAELAPYLPERLQKQALQEALARIRKIRSKSDRARALAELAPYLPEELLRETLVIARAIEDGKHRASTLAGLALCLAESGYLEKAVAAAHAIQQERYRAEAMVSLASQLPEKSRKEVLEEALASARVIRDQHERTCVLADLALRLVELGYPEKAMTAARAIGEEKVRARTLATLALRLAETGYPEMALDAAEAIGDEKKRIPVLANLAPRLAEMGYPREALAAARVIRDREWRICVLASLGPYLTERLRKKVFRQMLAIIRTIKRRNIYGTEALIASRVIVNDAECIRALATLVPHMPEALRRDVLTEALAAIRAIEYEPSRATALSYLAPHLPEELLGEAMDIARTIERDYWHATTLADLISHLPETSREKALLEALAAVRTIGNEDERVNVSVFLASRLAELGYPRAALAVAREIRYGEECAQTLVALVPHLPSELLEEALAVVSAIKWEPSRAKALVGLAPYLTKELLGKALAVARAVEREDSRVEALVGLTSHLPGETRDEILKEALAVAYTVKERPAIRV